MKEDKAQEMLNAMQSLTSGILNGPKKWWQKKQEDMRHEDTASIIDEISRLSFKLQVLSLELRQRLSEKKF